MYNGVYIGLVYLKGTNACGVSIMDMTSSVHVGSLHFRLVPSMPRASYCAT